ncbi:MAG: hypothetical protein KDD61_03670 [Bdellovibrionales bacterium]|nr:hypothetical protein [Bdellovibrionales bacterium]
MALSLNDIQKKKKKPQKKPNAQATSNAKSSDVVNPAEVRKSAESVKPWSQRIDLHQEGPSQNRTSRTSSSAKKAKGPGSSKQASTKVIPLAPAWHNWVRPPLMQVKKLGQSLSPQHPVRLWLDQVEIEPELKIPLPELFIHKDDR